MEYLSSTDKIYIQENKMAIIVYFQYFSIKPNRSHFHRAFSPSTIIQGRHYGKYQILFMSNKLDGDS